MSAATAPAADEREQQSDRLAALHAIYDAPVLWRTHDQGYQTIPLADALRAEEADLASAASIPDHLRAGAERRATTVRDALRALADPQHTTHPYAALHRQTIVEGLRNLPTSRWEYDGPIVVAAPPALLTLLDRLTFQVNKESGIEIRMWDGCGDDTICIARDGGNGRRLLHLAGPRIPEGHIHLYQMLREGLWPADVCERISCAL